MHQLDEMFFNCQPCLLNSPWQQHNREMLMELDGAPWSRSGAPSPRDSFSDRCFVWICVPTPEDPSPTGPEMCRAPLSHVRACSLLSLLKCMCVQSDMLKGHSSAQRQWLTEKNSASSLSCCDRGLLRSSLVSWPGSRIWRTTVPHPPDPQESALCRKVVLGIVIKNQMIK